MNNEEVQMLENDRSCSLRFLSVRRVAEAGATSELQYLSQQNAVEETRGRLLQSKADRLRQIALLDQQTAQLKSDLADLKGRLVETKVTSATSSSGRQWMVWFLISSQPPVDLLLNQHRP